MWSNKMHIYSFIKGNNESVEGNNSSQSLLYFFSLFSITLFKGVFIVLIIKDGQIPFILTNLTTILKMFKFLFQLKAFIIVFVVC